MIASRLSNSPVAFVRRFRSAKLSDEQIEEVARKVMKELQTTNEDTPDDGTIVLLDEGSPEQEVSAEKEPEKEEKPIEHKEEEPITMGDAKRAARIASLVVAEVFPSREALEKYLKDHPDADRSQHSVKEFDDTVKVMDEDGESKEPAEKEKDGKPSVKKEEKPTQETKKEIPEDAKLRGQLENAVGKENAAKWKTHGLHKSQITEHTKIQFPDGSTKKYSELDDKERARVEVAIKANKVAHTGMNDYTKVDKDTLASNMANNLSRYDNPSVKETKNETKEPVTKDNVKEFAGSVRKNAGSILDKYSDAMSETSRGMAKTHIEYMASAIEGGFADNSLGNVSQADLDDFCREEVKRMVHQEIESRRRSLGDHGIRHLAANSDNTMKMMNELNTGGITMTGKDRLMGLCIQANHDMGYTVGIPATSFKGSHQENSGILAGQESDRYSKIFGKDESARMAEIIKTHDSPDLDWEKEPLKSAVRLSDNISLWGKDKVQDLYLRAGHAMEHVCALRMAAEMEPPKPREPEEKDYKDNPEKFKDAQEEYKGKLEEYMKPEVQAQVKEAQGLQAEAKKRLHKVVDEEKFNDNDKELLHSQIDEMSEVGFSTSSDILGRMSGRIEDMKFDKNSKVMNVNMKYSPECQMTDSLFGDKIAKGKVSKMVKDLKGQQDKDGSWNFSSGGKSVARLNMEGFYDDPEETATTEGMKSFIEKTARMTFARAKSARNADEAHSYLEKDRKKFTDGEWDKVEKTFDGAKGDMNIIRESLSKFIPLESERAYLGRKTASIVNRIIVSMLKAKVKEKRK